jgi:hypothetical protein
VLVELDLLIPFEPIEVLEQQKLLLLLASRTRSAKVLNERPRINLLLDVQRDCGNCQWNSILLILPSPDELRIGVWITWVEQRTFVLDGDWIPLVVGNEISKFLGRNVRTLVGMGS